MAWTAALGVESPGLNLPVTIGGTGAAGGKGGAVTVNSTGDIRTSGFGSYGILAQSVGGGGGSGGNSTAGSFSINTMVENIGIGGKGDVGGNGDVVEVDSSGAIETDGDFASAIFAQSIGGGGGNGGNSTTLTTAVSVPIVTGWEDLLPSPSMQADLTIGGDGDGGGTGGRMDVTTTGKILTRGSFANGVLAQSIGGGGGVAGDSKTAIVELSMDPMDFIYGSMMSPSITIMLGGAAGLGGNGGEVSVNSQEDIATEGHFANGVLAQSIGGGGGTGGNVTKTSLSLGLSGMPGMTDLLGLTVDNSADIMVGGSDGGGGDGAGVTVRNHGDITTKGRFANGILAQSVGGGGGVGGDVTEYSVEMIDTPVDPLPIIASNPDADIRMGGRGGNGGNGGTVTVHNYGAIGTEGDFANGILAQSIGGGGGVAGSLSVNTRFLVDPEDPPSMVLTGSSAGSGNGGAVTVENSGDIVTHGRFAHGILAQSVGGGGGFGGISEEPGPDAGPGVSTLASGLRGVFMQNTGSGVGFAGSAGGSGSAGPVTVTHTGSIIADGMDSDGILAQSIGSSGLGGNISININSGTVRGGSGAGAGVNIDGGRDNTLTNAGAISALSGRAILGGVGNDTIHNYGTVSGGVHLGSGANAFNNEAGARFDPGTIIDLGNGNALTNAGILSPGGLGAIVDTTLIGDLVLSASSVLEMEIGGFTPGSFDSLDVTGSVTSAGTVGCNGRRDGPDDPPESFLPDGRCQLLLPAGLRHCFGDRPGREHDSTVPRCRFRSRLDADVLQFLRRPIELPVRRVWTGWRVVPSGHPHDSCAGCLAAGRHWSRPSRLGPQKDERVNNCGRAPDMSGALPLRLL